MSEDNEDTFSLMDEFKQNAAMVVVSALAVACFGIFAPGLLEGGLPRRMDLIANLFG